MKKLYQTHKHYFLNLKKQIEEIIKLIGTSKKLLELKREPSLFSRIANKRKGIEESASNASDYIDIWVNASEYIWPNNDLATNSYNQLVSRLERELPFLRIILEIKIPRDIYDNFYKQHKEIILPLPHLEGTFPSNERDFDGDSEITSQQRYLSARDQAYSTLFLQGGKVLVVEDESEEDEMFRFPLASKILEERLRKLDDLLLETEWNSLWIHGAPGSGKSELAKKFAGILANEKKNVVLVLSGSDFSESSEISDKKRWDDYTIRNLLSDLIEQRLIRHFNIPDDGDTKSRRAACRHVAKEFSNKKYKKIVLLIDEIDYFRELRQATMSLLKSTPDLGIKMICVSRSQPPESLFTIPKNFDLRLDTFTLGEAKLILKQWLPKMTPEEISELVSNSWLGRTEDISLYMLRLIFESVGITEHQPARILKEVIRKIVRPLEKIIDRESSPEVVASTLLRVVEDRLRAPNVRVEDIRHCLSKEYKDIDSIEVLGNLAWASKYEEEKAITESSLIKWSKNSISEKTVGHFIEEGCQAKIFRKGLWNTVMWNDQFLAHGCAVLKLQREEDPNTIATMASTLVEKNESEMLGLAADYETFQKITNVIVPRKIPVQILKGIFSEQAIESLKTFDSAEDKNKSSYLLESICKQLIDLSEKLPWSEKIELSDLLARLAENNQNTRNYIQQSLSSSQDIAQISALVWGRIKDPEDYIEDYRNLGGPNSLHALSAAATIWPTEEGHRLAQWCDEKTELTQEQKHNIFKQWCARQGISDLINFISEIKANFEEEDPNLQLRRTAMLGTLESLRTRSKKLKEEHRVLIMKTFQSMLTPELDSDSFDKLIKSLVQLYHPEMPITNAIWLPDKEYKLAAPSVPMEPTTLTKIFDYFVVDSKDSICARILLANSENLKNVPNIEYDGKELVDDRNLFNIFRKKSDGNIELQDRSSLLTWDGENSSLPPAELKDQELKNIGTNLFRWRPVFRID